MKIAPLNTKVLCTDGPAGESTCLIVDPGTLQITHFVVAERKRPHTERIVPIELMVDVGPDSIRLACTVDKVAEMKRFVRTTFRQIEVPRYSGADLSPYAYSDGSMIEVEVEQVPAGEVAIRQGGEVEAADGGTVGRVAEISVEPDSGQITHIVVRERKLWGRRDVLIPASAVREVYEGRLRLALDQETLAGMLAIPTGWRAGGDELELIASVFADEKGAREALKAVKKLSKQGEFEILNAAVLVRDTEGKTSLRETEDVDPARGTLFGALTGGLIGLAGGPVGAVLGAAAGAATGRAAAAWIDAGFPDDYLVNLAEQLQPGTSTLITLLDAEQADWVAAALDNLEGQVTRQALDGQLIDDLTVGLEHG